MAATEASGIPPNQTIYVNNLNEKLKKEALKKALFAVFSQFGRILDIVALKTLRMRGQAWVVFADVTSASNALRQMQGFPFYDKPMVRAPFAAPVVPASRGSHVCVHSPRLSTSCQRIAFAKSKSDAVARREGTYVPRDKRKRMEEAEEAGRGGGSSKKAATGAGTGSQTRAAAPAPSNSLPNKILFAQNLPKEATEEVLRALFQQYAGFKEVRSAAGTGVAFIEFENETQSTAALQVLNNFKLSHTDTLQLTYARS